MIDTDNSLPRNRLETREYETNHLPKGASRAQNERLLREMVNRFMDDKAPYPVIAICRDCGGQRRGLLVPPLAMKFDLAPALTPLVSEAKTAFDAADVIVVVGFSFAEADAHISRMLSKSVQTKSGQKLLIVDPDHRVVHKVRRKFKASIPNFDVSRIIHLSGDCAEGLPKFLSGELAKAEPTHKPEGEGEDANPRRRRRGVPRTAAEVAEHH